jgi:serine protease Do
VIRKLVTLSIAALLGLAGGARVAGTPAALAAQSPPAPGAQDLPASRRTAIVTAAQKVSPAVVSISVVATRVVNADPFGGMFHDEFFDRFYPQMQYRQQVSSMGSGVIVDAGGLVVTNEHVVRDAEKVTVTLPDGRQLASKLLGASATYDLAVLKVEGAKLPVAPLGNSDALVVGEWAIAIGNPFGYLLTDAQPSVTAGVVSATHRDIRSEATDTGVYKNMIQTDAAINPGNSGGPLVNADGEVIGINAFIFTQGGGSLGIGFAIPINLVKRVLEEVQKYGRVRVAWSGMQVQPVTAYLAQRLGYKDVGGLVVTRVETGGPAAKAGLKVGDRIRMVNGITVNSVEDAQRSIYGAGVGEKLAFRVERGEQTLDLGLVLAEAPRSASP